MKTLNLTIAIIYTIMLSLLLISGMTEDDFALCLGIIIFTPPVIANWISYANYKK